MSSQKFLMVFGVTAVFSSLLLATGAVPSSLLERQTRSMSQPAKQVKTYSALGGEKKVTITDDRIEVVVVGQLNSSQMIGELKSLQEITKALNKRLQVVEKLHGNDFALLFPKKGTTDYVFFRGMPSVQAVTGCMWLNSNNKDTNGCLFSYAVSGTYNELILHDHKNLVLWVGDQSASASSVAVNDGRWHHTCFTWENTAGSWNIYVDASRRATGTGLKRGHVIRAGGVLMLGQEQDAVAGGFDAGQSFVGEMSQVNLWDRVLSAQEIAEMSKSCRTREGNVFKWSDFKHAIHGAVQVIEPSPCGP